MECGSRTGRRGESEESGDGGVDPARVVRSVNDVGAENEIKLLLERSGER